MRPAPDAIAASSPTPHLQTRLGRLVACEVLLVVVADRLFWGHKIGLSLPLFAGAVTLAAFIGLPWAGPRRPTWSRGAAAALILGAGVLPSVEDLSLLSAAFALAGTALAVELFASGTATTRLQRMHGAAARLAGGLGRIWRDAALARRIAGRGRGAAPASRAALLAWVVPITLLATFLALFASANPVIAGWLADLPRPGWPDLATLVRSAFWTCVPALTWALVRARPSRPQRSNGQRPVLQAPAEVEALAAALLGPTAILRTLVACNLLFAVQLALDGAYLWGGLSFPPGIGYAAYAHRGAYPLVATALLSAAFVLVARTGERRRNGRARLIPALALAFTGQNVLLVISSMRRLALYVDAYSLTGLRVAAFLWMLLVAVGLALIMLRSALGRSNAWLVGRVSTAALAVIYGSSFLDVPAIVAAYNVDHCAEVRGSGPALDLDAIAGLGPGALPALDRYLAAPWSGGGMRNILLRRRAVWVAAASTQARDWRAWSLRVWRLGRYLDRIGTGPAGAGPANPAALDPNAPDDP